MKKYIQFLYVMFLLLTSLSAQQFYTPLEVGTAGAYLGGRLGTHAIHSNPALLGISPEQVTEMVFVDTFDLSYSVIIESSSMKDELIELKERLVRDGLDRIYLIEEKDSLYTLMTRGFNDSFSAYNFSSNLPSTLSNQIIKKDTTYKQIGRPKIQYGVQVLATPNKDSLRVFRKRTKKLLKALDKEVVFVDSLFKYQVGFMDSEEEAITLKNSPLIQGIASDAFIISKLAKVSTEQVPRFSITLPTQIVFNMGSNIISADWINNIIGADMVNEPSKKYDILNGIPSSGILGYFGVNGSLFDMSIGNYGVSLFHFESHYSLNIPKPLTEVIFDGIRLDQPEDISDFDFKGVVVNTSTISYGRKLDIEAIPYRTHVGIGLRLHLGSFNFIESYNGQISTSGDSINIFSDISIMYLDPKQVASGLGVDLGIYTNLNEKLSAQLSFINLGGYLNSEKINRWRSIKDIRISSEDIDEFQSYTESEQDSALKTFSILDETKPVPGTFISLPSKINFYSNYIYTNNIHLKAAFQFIMQTDFIGSVDPRFSLGLELFPNNPVPVLFGISLGGVAGTTLGLGVGLKLKSFEIDLGFSQSGGLGNSATGFSLSTGMRLLLW